MTEERKDVSDPKKYFNSSLASVLDSVKQFMCIWAYEHLDLKDEKS